MAATKDGIWVVSDRGGWLARYSTPLRPGLNHPSVAHQLKPALKHRVKWEGLGWERDARRGEPALLLLEAISRSVWRCVRPAEGCPNLSRITTDALNAKLDDAVARPFKYIMFEALSGRADKVIIGTRGYQDQERGLTPWSILIDQDSQTRFAAPRGVIFAGRRYGVSGATYDAQRGGYWLTWSYEDESRQDQDSVSGLLTFISASLQAPAPTQEPTHDSSRSAPSALKLCARLPLKPEGVTVSDAGALTVVFDEDRDRKRGELNALDQQVKRASAPAAPMDTSSKERFSLRDSEDFVWSVMVNQVLQACAPLPPAL